MNVNVADSGKEAENGMVNCPNCQSVLQDRFCARCGQKKIGRLTIREVWDELLQATIEADRSLFQIIWQTFVRPGYLAREYLEGKRKRFFSPFQFMLLLTGVSIFLVSQLGLDEKMIRGMAEMQSDNPEVRQLNQSFMQAVFQYQALFMILIIPFFAFAFRWIYKKEKLNFAESYFLVVICMNLSNLINNIFLYPVAFFEPNFDFVSFSMLGFWWAFFFTFHQFAGRPPIWKSIVKSFLVIVIGYGMIILTSIFGAAGWIFLKHSLVI